MEIDGTVFDGKQNLERYADQPIVPHVVEPIALYNDELIKMGEDRRESNFSIQSDISITNNGSDTNLPHLKYFRTPSVVVSDHSEDTGCVTYDDIRRIHNAYHRRRRSKSGRRHSDVFLDLNEKIEFGKRSDSTVSGSTQSDATEYFRGSHNESPIPRRKGSGYRDGSKPLSFDEDLGDFDVGGAFERKTLSECSSSNELSPIMSHCCSSNYSETSSRSSICSEISPVLVRKNMHFSELQERANFDPPAKSEKNALSFPTYFQSRHSNVLDDTDFLLLERQRSLSYDDLYHNPSVISEFSCSDLSIDFSACSSLSNLPGTVYYSNYNPRQDSPEDCEYSATKIGHRKTNKSQESNIKTSKSCSDFLSVSRIADDYPHLRHRRHSNDQVSCDIAQYSNKSCYDGIQRRWMINVKKYSPNNSRTQRDISQLKNPWERLFMLQLKSFHASLNFQDEGSTVSNKKSKSIGSVFTQEKKNELRRAVDSKTNSCIRLLPKTNQNDYFKVKFLDRGENKVINVVSDNKKTSAKKEWLSVEWKNGDFEGEGERRNLRKISDCSTCSTFSGDYDMSGNLNIAITKAKTSGWKKLRNIVQWTPFFQIYKKQRYPWVQLAGHQGNFKAGPEQGTILKKLCPKEEKCYKILMKDVLRPYVPEYKGQVTCDDSDCIYLQLQDLLVDFTSPCVLDCKLGVRTYLEEELQKAKEKPKLRKDMYEKMIQIDPNAPTLEEHKLKAVTKPRYMVWRETISSTSTLGFRLEGIRKSDGKSSKDFKTTRTKEEVKEAFRDFTSGFPHSVPKYVQRLKAIKATLEVSIFFSSHEIIGSSLLFVHDNIKANVWLIDFAKTLKLPDQTFIDHKSQWEVGNHEDGYLIGINNLIEIFGELENEQKIMSSDDRISAVTENDLSSFYSTDQT